MYGELTTKRSPIVLIWKFAVIEAVGFLAYFVATLFGNAKYDLYTQLSLSNLLSYQTAKILFLLGAQFVMLVYAFLSWYYEEYTIRPETIVHARGVFKRKQEEFKREGPGTPIIRTGLFGKFFHYGSIKIKNGSSLLVLAHISRPERVIRALEGEYLLADAAFGKEPDVSRLLEGKEHDRLEFKSSLRFDYKAGNTSRELEKAVMKTTAAFLNSNGGYLVLGVSDKRVPVGLLDDYRTLQRKDRDGFENHFTQVFNGMIGPEFRSLVKLWFRDVGGNDICVVQALQSPRPAYLKADNSEHFYVRTGNISTSLKLSEIEAYSRSRWPNRIS